MTADVKAIMRCWEDLKQTRLQREGEWQQIADYFCPRKTFNMEMRPGELVRRRVTSSIGPRALTRGAALLAAYLVDPTLPFIGPNVEGGLVRQGRAVTLDAAAKDYMDNVEWRLHGVMVRPRSNYMASTAQVCVELYAFGSGVRWTGRKRGFGPRYTHRPLRQCWFAENEDGEIDTLYFQFTLPVWRACQRYPELAKNDEIKKRLDDDKRCQEPLRLLHVVSPRAYGRIGAVATAKPFQSVVLAIEEQAVGEESGYDSFPYSITRLGVEEGATYGTGLAWYALPNVAVYNALQQGVELAVALKNNPPKMRPARLFPKPFDQRPGANNLYDPVGLGFQNLKDAVLKLDVGGDPGIGAAYMKDLRAEVDEIFFIDWMNLNDGVQKTAEEIRDRRDLRVRALSSMVPTVDRDLIGKDADRTLEVMVEEGLLPPPPPSLSGLEVDWDYKGPLAMLQKRGQVETIDRLFDLALKGKNLDEGGAAAVMVDECLRVAADATGLTQGPLRSREEMAQIIAAANDRAEQMHAAQLATAGGAALRDGAQGIATLRDGLGGGKPPGEQLAA